MPTEKDLEYGKRHGFDKLEERENAKLLAGIDTNASSTAKDGRTVKKKPRSILIQMTKTVSQAEAPQILLRGLTWRLRLQGLMGPSLETMSQVVRSRWYALGCGINP